MQTTELLKTPMYDYYTEQGLKLTDFGGWALPIQFTKIQDEHDAVRNNVGIFDASHMGEILISDGKEDVYTWLNRIITNDTTKNDLNGAQYTAVVNEDGMTLDDLIYYHVAPQQLLLTPNASNTKKILGWLNKHNDDGQVSIEDQSSKYGLIAVQGPESQNVMEKLTDANIQDLKGFTLIMDTEVAGVSDVIISKTGYTGELGYELYIPWNDTPTIWKALLEAGDEFNIKQCGLGARDTLRLEAGMALYGNDLSEEISPIEAGIAFAVDFNKLEFIGKEALTKIKADPNRYMSRGFELVGKGIARHDSKVYETAESEQAIGIVTSGTKSPSFNKAIGYVMVEKPYAKLNNTVYIEIRNKRVEAVLTKKDWLKRA